MYIGNEIQTLTLLQIYKPFSFTHITIWFNLSIQMMNQIKNSIYFIKLSSEKEKKLGDFLRLTESHAEILIIHIELMVFHN